RRRHTRWPRDWSSDVCSSDLSNTVMATVTVGAPNTYAVATNPATNRVYVALENSSNTFSVIDGTSNAVMSFALPGGDASAIAVRSEERRVGKGCRCRWASAHA